MHGRGTTDQRSTSDTQLQGKKKTIKKNGRAITCEPIDAYFMTSHTFSTTRQTSREHSFFDASLRRQSGHMTGADQQSRHHLQAISASAGRRLRRRNGMLLAHKHTTVRILSANSRERERERVKRNIIVFSSSDWFSFDRIDGATTCDDFISAHRAPNNVAAKLAFSL